MIDKAFWTAVAVVAVPWVLLKWKMLENIDREVLFISSVLLSVVGLIVWTIYEPDLITVFSLKEWFTIALTHFLLFTCPVVICAVMIGFVNSSKENTD